MWFFWCDIILSCWVSRCLWSCWINCWDQISRKLKQFAVHVGQIFQKLCQKMFAYDKIGYNSIIFSPILLFLYTEPSTHWDSARLENAPKTHFGTILLAKLLPNGGFSCGLWQHFGTYLGAFLPQPQNAPKTVLGMNMLPKSHKTNIIVFTNVCVGCGSVLVELWEHLGSILYQATKFDNMCPNISKFSSQSCNLIVEECC